MFSDDLRNKRLQKGYSQAELARKIGITRDLYNKYEKTTIRPPYETLSVLAVELDTTIDFLITGNASVLPYQRRVLLRRICLRVFPKKASKNWKS